MTVRVGSPGYRRKLERNRSPNKYMHRAKRSGITAERHHRLMAIAAATTNTDRVPPLKDFTNGE